MCLKFIKVNCSFVESKLLDDMMKRQFPPEEYMPLDNQLALQDSGDIEIWALYDLTELVGFTTLRITNDMAYLFFLAFDDAFQGKGYGKEAIAKIRELYTDRAITVDFELVDEKAANNEQRIRRRNFYLKNGFYETGWGLSYLGVDYEIFCMNQPFSIDSFKAMLNKLPIRGFHPQYFRL